jgi:hypothetical protein
MDFLLHILVAIAAWQMRRGCQRAGVFAAACPRAFSAQLCRIYILS